MAEVRPMEGWITVTAVTERDGGRDADMVKVTSDSTCDLTPKMLENLDVALAPLHIIAGERDFKDGVDIHPEDVFRYTEVDGKHCRSSAVNAYEYSELFGKYAKEFDSVVHICIGSGFSACFQNATIAAGEFDNVYIVDSRNLTTGSGHLVYDAALMARQGLGAEEICRRLEEEIPLVDASFVIERLDYLHKGGRCSGLEALGASLLKLRPCIEVVDNRMRVGRKYRGSFERCLEQYVEEKLTECGDIDYSRVFITHPMCPEGAVARVREAVVRHAGFEEIIETKAGCTVSAHCGPNTLGIIFKHRAN